MDEKKVKDELAALRQLPMLGELLNVKDADLADALQRLSLFSKEVSESHCEAVVNTLQDIIQKLSSEVKVEGHELDAQSNGGKMFTPDELELIDEYAYCVGMRQRLEKVLDAIYEARPEFKPRP